MNRTNKKIARFMVVAGYLFLFCPDDFLISHHGLPFALLWLFTMETVGPRPGPGSVQHVNNSVCFFLLYFSPLLFFVLFCCVCRCCCFESLPAAGFILIFCLINVLRWHCDAVVVVVSCAHKAP